MSDQLQEQQSGPESVPAPALNIPQESPAAPEQAAPEQHAEAKPDQVSPEQAQPENEPPGEQDAPEQAASEQPEEDKPKRNRTREFIERLQSRARDAEARAQAADAELQRLQKRLTEQPQIDEDDYEAQQAQNMRRTLDEDRLEQAQSARDTALNERRQARNETFAAKLEAAAERLPDVAEKFFSVPVTENMADFIADSDAAPELAHWLGSNPHEALRLSQMDPVSQARELARQEARISAAPKARKVSQAPQPPSQVTGTVSPSAKDPAEMTMEEYAAWRSKSGD